MSKASVRGETSKKSAGDCSFEALLDRLRSGDQEAWRQLYARFQRDLLRLIRRRFLRPKNPLRPLVDSDDIGQLVWERAFASIVHGNVAFSQEKEFFNFLTTIAENSFRKEYRFYVLTRKRSLNRQESLDSENAIEMATRSDDPVQDAAASDEYWQFLGQLPTERRAAIRVALEEGGIPELARRLGRNERATKRFLVAMQSRWIRGRSKN